jgi:murein DD-endopeptidase MepM/ murein hydrolase activator NlpD
MLVRPLLAMSLLALPACYDSVVLELPASDAGSTNNPGSSDPFLTTTNASDTSTSGDHGTSLASGGTATGEASTTSEASTTGGAGSTGETSTTDADSSTGADLDACPRLRVQVAPDPTLNVRPTPSTEQAPVASLPHGAIVEVVAAVQGEAIQGNPLWYQIAAPAGYVSGVFVICTQDLPPDPPAGFYLPFECGKQVKVTQGNNGGTSHTGVTQYAFDFGLGLNTPVHASAAGVITNIYDQTGPGDPCYNGGGPDCGPAGNLVIVHHGDDTATLYKHLNEVHVSLGQEVPQGFVLGLSGSTGYSTGPHLHTMRMNFCGKNNCQSIPMEYVEAGVPVEGQFVTSQNCP